MRDHGLGKRVVDRIVAMLINEAVDALHMRVADAADIELAMTKGVNYPRGLLAWGDELGVRAVLQRIDGAPGGVRRGSVPAESAAAPVGQGSAEDPRVTAPAPGGQALAESVVQACWSATRSAGGWESSWWHSPPAGARCA